MRSFAFSSPGKNSVFDRLRLLLPLVVVLGLAYFLGRHASFTVLLLLLAGIGLALLLHRPQWGLLAIPAVALLVPIQFGTGTDVALTAAVFIIPAVAGVWLLHRLLTKDSSILPSRLYRPLIALSLLILFSFLRGNVMWDPTVPKPGNAVLVQIGQIAIYYLSFLAFFLMVNLARDVSQLRKVAYGTLFIGTIGLVLIWLNPLLGRLIPISNHVMLNSFSVWLVALPLALATYDEHLNLKQRRLLYGLALAALATVFQAWVSEGDWVGGWGPPVIAAAVVLGIRHSKLRFLSLILFVTLLIAVVVGDAGLLESGYWQQKWDISGGSRMALWQSIVELASQSPIFGLGIVAYRHYHFFKPLVYQNAYWVNPSVSAHNMWVDMFAQLGIVGVLLYLWFLLEVGWLAWNLYHRSIGFARGYALAALGALLGIIFADMLAETSLPFVYNMSFQGFRASVVNWMLLGGLVILENQTHKTSTQTIQENSEGELPSK